MAWIVNFVLGPHRFETRSSWGVLTAICAIFACVILSLVAVIVLGIAVSAALPEFGAAMGRCMDIAGPQPAECSVWFLASAGVLSICLCGSFYLLSHARKGSTPQDALLLRASGLRWWQYLLLIVIMMGVVVASESIVSVLAGATQSDLEQGIEYLKVLLGQGGWQQWALIIAVVVIAGPLAEEMVFRGFMFTTLLNARTGFIGAALITSACWTVLHYNYSWQILLVLFVFGFCLAYAVWRTGSLWPGVIAHSANNLVSAVVLALR